MLTELCQELRNWFDRERYYGTFTIENGNIILVPIEAPAEQPEE